MENKRNQCNRCEGIGILSKAYDNTFIEFLDLGSKPGDRGNTLSKSGPAKLVCLNAYGTINVSKEDSDFILKEKNHSIKFDQKQFKEFNQKQFKEFDHKLFTAYINKFSDDDKILAIRYIHKSMPDSNFKKFLSQWFE